MADANTQDATKGDDVFSKFGKGMLAGAIAGAAGKTATAPIDRIKMIYQVAKSRTRLTLQLKVELNTFMQVDPHKVFTFRDAFATSAGIVKRAGSAALWRYKLDLLCTHVWPS